MATLNHDYGTAQAGLTKKVNRENVDFQQYLLECEETIPRNHYTDTIFKSGFLNSFVVRLNKIVVFLFYNCINASLQSDDTIIRRRMFQAYNTANRNKLTIERDKLSTRRSSTKESKVKADEQPECHLSLPNRNKFAFMAFFITQVLIWLHYVLAQIVLNNPYNKKYGITSSHSLETFQTLVKIEHEPVNLRPLRVAGELDESSVQLSSCLSHLESYILERYGKFYVWNMSVSHIFNGPLMEDYLLVEQNVSLQMFSDEVTLFCHTIAFFLLSSGILACLLAEFKPYDIAPLTFIYDPRYIVHHIKSRVRNYMNIVQVSYKNYWSAYHINAATGLCKCMSDSVSRGNQLSMQGIDEFFADDTSPMNGADRFDDYIPGPRGPTWRLALIVASPVYQIISSALITTTLGILYIFFVAGNDGATELNNELKQFLRNGTEPLGLKDVLMSHCLDALSRIQKDATNEQSLEMLSSYVRWKMIEYFSSILRRLSPDLSMLKLDAVELESTQEELMELYSLPPLGEIGAIVSTSLYEREPVMQMHKRLVVGAIEPSKKPSLINWTVPFIGGLMTGLLFSLYFAIFFSVIADLCFWLFNIRMKFDICKVLLRHYNKRASADKNSTYQQVRDGTHKSFISQMDEPWPAKYLSAEHEELEATDLDCLAELPASGSARAISGEQSSYNSFSPKREHRLLSSNLVSPLCLDAATSNFTENMPLYPISGTFSKELERTSRRNRRTLKDRTQSENKKVRKEIISNCNTNFRDVIYYAISSRSRQRSMCVAYAQNIIQADSNLGSNIGLGQFKHCVDSFLLSAYLDFRLFLEQIETCRFPINFMLSYSMLHALNIIAASQFTELLRSKIGFLGCGYVLANITLIGSSFFQSQCTKLISPIYSILASSLNGDKTVRHLASLWRRALLDLSGPHSKFSFRVYSLNISYATALQFNLGVTSLYILTLDKMRYRV